MIKNIFDTSLVKNWADRCYNEYYYDIAPEHFKILTKVLFSGISYTLKNAKTKTSPVAFEIRKLNNQLVAAAIVEYIENEDKTNPGNYTLVWTFEEEDIPENAVIISFNNPEASRYFTSVAAKEFRMEFNSSQGMIILFTTILEEIKKYLDENAKETDEVGIELEGVFQARVAVENEVKVFAIEPDGLIKVLIKDDTSIEK